MASWAAGQEELGLLVRGSGSLESNGSTGVCGGWVDRKKAPITTTTAIALGAPNSIRLA